MDKRITINENNEKLTLEDVLSSYETLSSFLFSKLSNKDYKESIHLFYLYCKSLREYEKGTKE